MSLIVVATNKSALAPVSDYNYEVLIGDGTRAGSYTITCGEIKSHTRSDGWKKLIQRILDQSSDIDTKFINTEFEGEPIGKEAGKSPNIQTEESTRINKSYNPK